MSALPRRLLTLLGLAMAGAAGTVVAGFSGQGFDHWAHRKLFPSCTSCHAGAAEASRPLWPTAESCAACHDGTTEGRVDWSPPRASPASNLRFTHLEHATEVRREAGADSTLACTACHSAQAAPWMEVSRALNRQCLDCHALSGEHLAVADTACATCHVTLAQATGLSRARVAAFPVPPSHREDGFSLEGHGRLATGQRDAVAASCTTCHARDFCITCHVDAPEQRSIQALAPDARSLVHRATLVAPPGHRAAGFLSAHGAEARRAITDCRTCHTQESCVACHATQPAVARGLARAGPGRGSGAEVVRARPASHAPGFAENHAQVASAESRSCAACHARTECLDCHRPMAASAGEYHPAGFLTRHPVAAYGRETSCSDCHSPSGFCAACHQQAGLTAVRTLRPGFHDAKQFFLVGHGQAARQSLETCVSCHTERDCLTCHSVTGGRRFRPHGPGFDPARLRRKNPEACTPCHGVTIPEG